jgi:hypothetical protein
MPSKKTLSGHSAVLLMDGRNHSRRQTMNLWASKSKTSIASLWQIRPRGRGFFFKAAACVRDLARVRTWLRRQRTSTSTQLSLFPLARQPRK